MSRARPAPPGRRKRLAELDTLITQECQCINTSASRAFNGQPLASNPTDILLDDKTINPDALHHLLRLINRKKVARYGPNTPTATPSESSNQVPAASSSTQNVEDSSPLTVILKRRRWFYDLTLGAFDEPAADAPPTQRQFERYVRDLYVRQVKPRTKR
ncbi:hypothetical protein MJO28_012065 [Puccinia striiformis f. sp. tritici]|uniref:Uncharacterized protein n=1 Tax=Puccinia striiformis f. sp. tritici TaxID=168172 RepID=A0ACC0DYX5_9BASI|nr:hypothetical protein MJO28_012065 [Puccinia striiformis f. sp. tritici]